MSATPPTRISTRCSRLSAVAAAAAFLVTSAVAGIADEGLSPIEAFGLEQAPGTTVSPSLGVETSRELTQFRVTLDCSAASNTCYGDAFHIRRNRRFEIQNVSCVTSVDFPGIIKYVSLVNDFPSVSSFETYSVIQIDEYANDQNLFVSGRLTKFIVGPKQTMTIYVAADDDIDTARCSFTGDMVKY
jgi:hypothetical protein